MRAARMMAGLLATLVLCGCVYPFVRPVPRAIDTIALTSTEPTTGVQVTLSTVSSLVRSGTDIPVIVRIDNRSARTVEVPGVFGLYFDLEAVDASGTQAFDWFSSQPQARQSHGAVSVTSIAPHAHLAEHKTLRLPHAGTFSLRAKPLVSPKGDAITSGTWPTLKLRAYR